MTHLPQPAPLILTLQLAEPEQSWFERQRRLHFPPERNVIPAHITLFHKLPGLEEARIADAIDDVVRDQPAFTITVAGLRSLGRGVAYRLESPGLAGFRSRLAGLFKAWLGAQDRAGYRPHVTIQNKVAPETAARLLEALSPTFSPFVVKGEKVGLWSYLGGPWEARRSWTLPDET